MLAINLFDELGGKEAISKIFCLNLLSFAQFKNK